MSKGLRCSNTLISLLCVSALSTVYHLCTTSRGKRHSFWMQVDFVPASKVGQASRQQPEQAVPASDRHNDTDSSRDSPRRHQKRKRDGESDLRHADSRPEHRRAHRGEEEERMQDKRRDRDDVGYKRSRRRHESRDGSSSHDQDDKRGGKRQKSRSGSRDSRREEEDEVPTDTADAAAQDSR